MAWNASSLTRGGSPPVWEQGLVGGKASGHFLEFQRYEIMDRRFKSALNEYAGRSNNARLVSQLEAQIDAALHVLADCPGCFCGRERAEFCCGQARRLRAYESEV